MDSISLLLEGMCSCANLNAQAFREVETYDYEFRSTNSMLDSVAVHNQFYRKGAEFDCPQTPKRSHSLAQSPPRVERKSQEAKGIFLDAESPLKSKMLHYGDEYPKSLPLDSISVATASTADSSSVQTQSPLMNTSNTYWLDEPQDSVLSKDDDLSVPYAIDQRRWSGDGSDVFSQSSELRRVQSAGVRELSRIASPSYSC